MQSAASQSGQRSLHSRRPASCKDLQRQRQRLRVQGLFLGLGQMQGLGLQHLHGMGFIMAKLEAPDGLPVFSGPSYIEIVSTRAGVGAGWTPYSLACHNIAASRQDFP